MKINSSLPLTLDEVKKILKKREKESELGYEQKQVYEYCEKFIKENKTTVETLMKNKKITNECAISIVNIAPTHIETVKLILSKNKIALSDEEIAEIVKLF